MFTLLHQHTYVFSKFGQAGLFNLSGTIKSARGSWFYMRLFEGTVAFFYGIQQYLGPYSISLWPSVPWTLVQPVGGKSSRTPIGMGSSQSGFCMLSGMPRVHRVIWIPTLSPSHWLSIAVCSWFAYSTSLLGHFSVDDKGWQYGDPLQDQRGSFWISYQWSVSFAKDKRFLKSRCRRQQRILEPTTTTMITQVPFIF